MIGFLARLLCTRLVPLVVLAIAIFVGWLNIQPNPEATLFTMVYPALKGYVPPVWSGGFPESPVAPLPLEVVMEPRPEKEKFILLPGAPSIPEARESEDEAAAARYASFTEVKLAPYKIPQQGIGMCCRYTAYDPESVRRTILHYLRLGGRHIDTADLYLNHAWIGEALQIAMNDYKIHRSEIWVTTKLWPRSYGKEKPAEAVAQMLKDLQLEYVDLVLMHAPSNKPFAFFGPKSECATLGLDYKQCRLETWKALSAIRDEGSVRHLGVANFVTRQLEELQEFIDSSTEALAPIANNQFQFNPWMPDHIHETKEYCQKHGISMTAYSSFSGSALQHMQAFTADTLTKIAGHHNTTVAQILLSWSMQKGFIVIPGTANPNHMAENLQAYNVVLSDAEMASIDALKDDESAKDFFVGPPDDT